MIATSAKRLPEYFEKEILLHPENRQFPPFELCRLLGTVFEPTEGCHVCILIDFNEPELLIKDHAFLGQPGFPVQKNAYKHFYLGLQQGALDELGMTGGELFAYRCSHGSNLDLKDEVWDSKEIFSHWIKIFTPITTSSCASQRSPLRLRSRRSASNLVFAARHCTG